MSRRDRIERNTIQAELNAAAADLSKATTTEEQQEILASWGITDLPDEKVDGFVQQLRRQARHG